MVTVPSAWPRARRRPSGLKARAWSWLAMNGGWNTNPLPLPVPHLSVGRLTRDLMPVNDRQQAAVRGEPESSCTGVAPAGTMAGQPGQQAVPLDLADIDGPLG